MSNQEGMFADAEQQTYEPRPLNIDPREQAQRQESPQEQESQEEYGGYRGAYVDPGEQQRGGGKIYPEQRPGAPRRRSRWPLIVIVILAILFASGFVSRVGSYRGAPETRTFQTLSGAPNLVITDPNGNVRIHTGNSNGVTITATRSDSLFGGNSNNAVQYKQDGNTIDVSAPGGFGFPFGSGSVDLDVSVPDSASVQVQSGSGDIEISGPNGNIMARSGSGDITINGVQQGTVEADAGSGNVEITNVDASMTLHSGSGDVEARNVDGQVNATDGSGDISVRDSTLSGQSLLETGSGDVNFSGTLALDGSYQVRSGSGDVNVTLPNNAAFQLNAHSDSGDVSNDFGSDTVGSAPRPPLQINTGSGDIEINQGD